MCYVKLYVHSLVDKLKLQHIPFVDLFIDLFESALYVSGDELANLQEHFFTVYTALVQCTDIAADRSAAISVHCRPKHVEQIQIDQ